MKAGVREAVAGAGMQCMPSLCEVFWRFVCRGIWGMLAVDKAIDRTKLVLFGSQRLWMDRGIRDVLKAFWTGELR